MAGLSVEQILKSIEIMDIYKKDYDIIKKLLDTGNDKFFTKILEEIINGNLYWSDFEQVLANTNYPTVLEDNLKSQNKISDNLRKLIQLRQLTNVDYEYDSANPEEVLVLTNNYSERPNADKIKALYDSEVEKMRGNLLFELTRHKSGDSIITQAYKTQLYNAIKNGELAKRHLDPNDSFKSKHENVFISDTEITYGGVTPTSIDPSDYNPDDIWSYYEEIFKKDKSGKYKEVTDYTIYGPQKYYVEIKDGENINDDDKYKGTKQYTLTDDVGPNKNKKYYQLSQKKFDYINPDDIFFYITNAIIPIDSDLQVLDEFDKAYMSQHNIDETTMKQIKMTSLIMKKNMALGLILEEEEI